MKRFLLRCFTVLLGITLLTGLLPTLGFAADDELVLTKIGHSSSDTVSITKADARAVTLTVPFSYAGNTLDLSSGLIIEKASSIDSVITGFHSGAMASVGDAGRARPPVVMSVTYYKGGNTSVQHSTSYSITVARASRQEPIFTGTIAKTVAGAMPNTKINDITFSSADFTKLYKANDGTPLTSVSVTGSSLACGTLKITSGKAYANYTSGTPIPIEDIGSLVFDATAGGTVSYIVSAYAGGDTSKAVGTAVLTITVKGVTAPVISAPLSKTINVGTTHTFALSDFSSCWNLNNGTLTNIVITPSKTDCGTWYKGSGAFTGSKTFSREDIGTLKFRATQSGQAAFTWTVSTEYGTSAAGSGLVTINAAATTISLSTEQNTAKIFSASDFSTACKDSTGANLNYVYFTLPSPSSGTLYYGYSSPLSPGTAITSSSVLYYNKSPRISDVTFVPAASFIGTLTISYTGVATNNASYTGYINITVSGSGRVSYKTGENRAVWFSAADFNTACINMTGANLRSMRFITPAVAEGRLYYDYSSMSSRGSAVSPDTTYYMDYTPYIGYVAFVPSADFSGTVNIPYVAHSVGGTQFTGYIAIQVSGRTGSAYFADVGPSHEWAAGAIDYLYDAGIVMGTGGNLYSPVNKMTRGDFLLMLQRAMGYTGSTKSNFSDVPKGSYYYDAIAIAKALDIARGTDNRIGPDSPLTRQDAMVYIYRALLVTNVKLIPGSNADIAPYTDRGKISEYALEAVRALVKAGMIQGSYDKLNPTSILSRAEMAVVLYRVKISY